LDWRREVETAMNEARGLSELATRRDDFAAARQLFVTLNVNPFCGLANSTGASAR
jgi:hypothetical protein